MDVFLVFCCVFLLLYACAAAGAALYLIFGTVYRCQCRLENWYARRHPTHA